jgi:hypothetical protein
MNARVVGGIQSGKDGRQLTAVSVWILDVARAKVVDFPPQGVILRASDHENVGHAALE